MIIPNEIITDLKNSNLIIRKAIGDDADGIAAGLRLFGKPATPKWVYSQGYKRAVKWANFHENYKRWLGSFIFRNNQAGADILLLDLESWILKLNNYFNGFDPMAILNNKSLKDLILIRRQLNRVIHSI